MQTQMTPPATALQRLVLGLAQQMVGENTAGVPVVSDQAVELREWFDAALAAVETAHGDIDMRAPCQNGFNLIQTLLVEQGRLLTRDQVNRWLLKYGADAFFPDQGSAVALVTRYVENMVVGRSPIKRSPQHPRLVEAEYMLIANTLLVHLPAVMRPASSVMTRWADLLRLTPWSADQEKERSAAVLLGSLQRLCPQTDPHRTIERWGKPEALLRTTQASLSLPDANRSVLSPSGCYRRMADLALLHAAPLFQEQGRPDGLPDLPHARRRELVDSWILDPQIDAQQARARLWACLRSRPEVLGVLLASPGVPGEKRRTRAGELLVMRDEKGRSLSAFARVIGLGGKAGAMLAPWLSVGDMVASDGRGLLEQVLDALVAEEADCFRRTAWMDTVQPDKSAWSDWTQDEKEAVLGPLPRRTDLTDRVIDAMLSNVSFTSTSSGSGHPWILARCLQALLPDASGQARLLEATIIADALRNINTLARLPRQPASTTWGGRATTRNRTQVIAGCRASLDRWLGMLQERPLCLAIGPVEWQQLRYGVIDEWLEKKSLASKAEQDCRNILAQINDLMEHRTLQRDLGLRAGRSDSPPVSAKTARAGM